MPITEATASAPMLYIWNAGPRLAATNYWVTPHARTGLFYLRWNVGAARLLVPQCHEEAVTEMRTGHEVLITIGRWGGRPRGVELLWEDGSVTPYAIQMSVGQVDRRIPAAEAGRSVACHVYVRGSTERPILAGAWPARLRMVAQLPCLRRWGR